MQLTDKDGNIFGTGGLEITTSSGKPKVPVINTDITIGTTAIVGGVAGRLLFDDAGVVGETNGVHWDKVNSRMGFGTTTPAYGISHIGNIGVAAIFSQRDFGFGAYSQITQRASYIAYTTDGTTGLAIGAASGAARIQGFNGLPATSDKPIFLQSLGGNVGIGTTTDAGYKLDVNGNTRIQGNTTLTGTLTMGNGSFSYSANPNNWFTISGNQGLILNQANGNNGSIVLGASNSANFTVALTNTTMYGVSISRPVTPIAGSTNLTYNSLEIDNVINYTNATNSIVRGLYIHPTLTSVTDFRAIETTVGNVLFGTTSGNVGIGTASPTNKLDISFIPNRLISFTQRPGYADYGRIVFSNVTGADIASSGNISLIPGDANEIISFGSFLTRSAFTASSNYGTYSPTGVGFQVHSNKPFVFRNISTDINTDFFVFEAPNTGARRLFNIIQNSVSYLTVFPTGNVTIGTTTDAGYKLDVNGNTRSNRFYANDGITLQRISFEGFNNITGIDFNSTTGLFKFFASTSNFLSAGFNLDTIISPVRNTVDNIGDVVIQGGGSERARFKANGNVGIGTTTPTALLEVNGSARVQSGLTVSGSLNLNSSDISSAWTTYTPTWSTDGATQPSLGNGTITGAYKVIGKTVFVRVRLVFGTTTTAGTGAFYFSLPVNAAAAWGVQMPVSLLDNGNAWYQATVNGEYGGFTDKVALITQSAGGANSSQGVTGVFPITFASTDSIQFNGSYEIA